MVLSPSGIADGVPVPLSCGACFVTSGIWMGGAKAAIHGRNFALLSINLVAV